MLLLITITFIIIFIISSIIDMIIIYDTDAFIAIYIIIYMIKCC